MKVIVYLSESKFISFERAGQQPTLFLVEFVDGQERFTARIDSIKLFEAWTDADIGGLSNELEAGLLHGIYACNVFANLEAQAIRLWVGFHNQLPH